MSRVGQMRKDIFAVSISDADTLQTIANVYRKHQVILEPHGAAGWAGLIKNFGVHQDDAEPDQICVSRETAYPAKFPEEIRNIIGKDPDLPPSMEGLDHLEETCDRMENDYKTFKEYLKKNL